MRSSDTLFHLREVIIATERACPFSTVDGIHIGWELCFHSCNSHLRTANEWQWSAESLCDELVRTDNCEDHKQFFSLTSNNIQQKSTVDHPIIINSPWNDELKTTCLMDLPGNVRGSEAISSTFMALHPAVTFYAPEVPYWIAYGCTRVCRWETIILQPNLLVTYNRIRFLT